MMWFGLFFLVFSFYFVTFAYAETQDTKNKLTKYMGINLMRGVKDNNCEEIYG